MNPDYYQQCPTFKYEETEEGSDGMEVVRGGEEANHPPFHHILSEQAKSLIALQELQNEVGALLEFREVVMEAFPQLRSKVRSSVGGGGSSSGSGGCSGGSGVGSSRWEPGVRVRRKAGGTSSSSRPPSEEPRSRSNSRSSKTANTTTTTSSSGVADSGFCTKQAEPSEDELWTLLELIQAKGTRLRLEAESLRSRSLPPHQDRLQALIQERDRLLSRLSEMEREKAVRAEEACRLEERVQQLTEEKVRLESALAVAGTPRLGTLDGIVSSPTERIICPTGMSPSRQVTAAILKESNVLELQRHLITTTYENQVAVKKLDRLTRARELLSRQLEKCKEENEDLKFQLEEKSIELEGTRARVRLLEQRGIPLQLDDANSSTESAGQGGTGASSAGSSSETPKRPRSSRIPLKKPTPPPPPPSSSCKPPLRAYLGSSTPPHLRGKVLHNGGSLSSPSAATTTPPAVGQPGSRLHLNVSQKFNDGVDFDSLESKELDRSMRSEIVLLPRVSSTPYLSNRSTLGPRPRGAPLHQPNPAAAAAARGARKKNDPDSLHQYFDSIDSNRVDSDSLDMV